MSETPTIALVGHCGPDAFMLRSAVSRLVPGSNVVSIEDPADLEESLGDLDVLLVNRVLDGGFRQASGIELIGELSDRGVRPAMLLVSNFEKAQREAEAAGALPGFGKQQLYDRSTGERLNAAVQTARAG